jgi:hypothetical protein
VGFTGIAAKSGKARRMLGRSRREMGARSTSPDETTAYSSRILYDARFEYRFTILNRSFNELAHRVLLLAQLKLGPSHFLLSDIKNPANSLPQTTSP